MWPVRSSGCWPHPAGARLSGHGAQQLPAEKFLLPQQRELYQAMIQCREQGIELSLATLRAYVSEEALNELSALAAKYSDVNCTPDDIRLYLDRIARGTPVAKKAAEMSNDQLEQYLQSMREKKQGNLPRKNNRAWPSSTRLEPGRRKNHAENVTNRGTGPAAGGRAGGIL